MTCNHKWDVGSVIWEEDKPRIKTKCILCQKNIIVDFGGDYMFSENDESIHDRMKKEKRRR